MYFLMKIINIIGNVNNIFALNCNPTVYTVTTAPTVITVFYWQSFDTALKVKKCYWI